MGMLRPILFLLLLATIAAPAAAASFSAKLEAPSNRRIVAREINWVCAGDTCEGMTAESRPVVLCQALAKRAGKIEGFLVDGRALSDAELARCNAA
ncbi:MAG: CC_3452 family protein, partial [Sphingomicrobium sp.]